MHCFNLSACVDEVGTEYESETSKISEKLVYGDDDRTDYGAIDATDRRLRWADSVALLARPSGVTCSDGSCDIATSILNLCSGEKFYFYGQKIASSAVCTAFLVGPKLFATAGHCIDDQADCDNLDVVFGFTFNQTLNDTVPEENVYSCTKLITRKAPPDLGDYALFEVDRYVTNRVPHWVRYVGKVSDSQSVTIIGHGSGLPIKIDSGGMVKDNRLVQYYEANVDAFQGNSGGPSINNDTGVVEGIVSYQPLDDYSTVGGCLVVNTCSDSTGCPDVGFALSTRITEVSDRIPLHPSGMMAAINASL